MLIIAPALIMSVYAQDKVSVEGFISNEKGIRIPLVNIVNISNHTGTTSNIDGEFRMPSEAGDTLRFSAIGFIPKRIIVQASNDSPLIPLHIVMQTDTVQLSSVTIYAWPGSVDALKKAVLEMEPLANNQPDLHLDRPLKLDQQVNTIHPHIANPIPGTAPVAGGVSVTAPWQAMYDRYSKSGKSLRKRYELEQAKTLHERVLCYYNPELIREITRFKTDEEIEDFMEYCKITDEFVMTHTAYELMCTIRDCYLAYNEEVEE